MHEKATVSACAGGAPDGAQHWPPLVTELAPVHHLPTSRVLRAPLVSVSERVEDRASAQATRSRAGQMDTTECMVCLTHRRTRQAAFRHLCDVTMMPERCTM